MHFRRFCVSCGCLVGLVSIVMTLASCGSGVPAVPFLGPSLPPPPGSGGTGSQSSESSVVLSAGLSMLQVADIDTLSTEPVLSDSVIEPFDAVYELETAAGEEFSFTITARVPGNTGVLRLEVHHLAAGDDPIFTGVQSFATEGVNVSAAGLVSMNSFLLVTGDGFSQITIDGAVTRDQIFSIEVPNSSMTDEDDRSIGIRLTVGEATVINQAEQSATVTADAEFSKLVYSSDSYQFGLPTIAVSGDRYSFAAYDGDGADAYNWSQRKRVWFQYDQASDSLTGGEDQAVYSYGSSWRDQEIAALNNVLCIASINEIGTVTVDISLDRGASFSLSESFSGNADLWGARLVQIAISPAYTIGIAYWRTVGNWEDWDNIESELVFMEA
ncbi:MAG: hypothetical protein HUU29_14625, partial [Planctomycetaceae bacterium]|nr:hypothetical protein [Planctomycetaceae bacterium]